MPVLEDNEFTSFTFTPQEDREAAILSLSQKQRLQTKMAAAAGELLNIRCDVTLQENMTLDINLRSCYLQGQIDLIKLLLAESEEAQQPVVPTHI